MSYLNYKKLILRYNYYFHLENLVSSCQFFLQLDQESSKNCRTNLFFEKYQRLFQSVFIYLFIYLFVYLFVCLFIVLWVKEFRFQRQEKFFWKSMRYLFEKFKKFFRGKFFLLCFGLKSSLGITSFHYCYGNHKKLFIN